MGMGETIFGHFKILQDENRVRLLCVLEQSRCNVGELSQILQIPQPTISRHLKKLLEDGWLERETENTTSWYSFQPTFLGDSTNSIKKHLWDVIALEMKDCFVEDMERLQSVLVLRRSNTQNFFATVGRQWEDIRRGLFGDTYLLPTLLSLLPSDLQIVDMGCGTGDALLALAPFAKKLIGIDQSAEMLKLAQERLEEYDNIDFVHGNIINVKMENQVDVVLSMLVLHHLEDLDSVFQRVSQMMCSGGRFIILDMCSHKQVELQRNMGHIHLGFSREHLETIAEVHQLELYAWHTIKKPEDAVGPDLFLAIFQLP